MNQPGSSRKPLFSPPSVSVQPHLLLIPRFIDPALRKKVRGQSAQCQRRLGSEWVNGEGMTVISGFMGYPHILTLLAFVDLARVEKISFLGTAGTLGPERSPGLVHIEGVWSSGPLRTFSRRPYLELEGETFPGVETVRGVSVDMIQRETPEWLKRQRQRGARIVEMELFPLRAKIKKPITALMVLSDRITHRGIIPFTDRNAMSEAFLRGWRLLTGAGG